MRMLIIPVAALALVACQKHDDVNANDLAGANATLANEAVATNDAMAANDMTANAMDTPAATATINHTSWEYVDPKTKKPIQESVDDSGNYISQSGKEHIDHGTATMKDGKVCFDSKMDKEGPMCWTDPKLAEGASGETTNDKGEKLTVKRVAYVPLTM